MWRESNNQLGCEITVWKSIDGPLQRAEVNDNHHVVGKDMCEVYRATCLPVVLQV
jgi:hypothetical protein